MAKLLLRVEGADGQVELMTDRLIIHRRGIFNMLKHGLHARREIPLSSISSVNFRDAGFVRMGEIDFDFAGRSQLDGKQNKVLFTRKHQQGFFLLKEKLFEMMEQVRQK